MPVSSFIRSTASVPLTAPPDAGVTSPVIAVVFASKSPPIVSGHTTATSAAVILNASSEALALDGSSARPATKVIDMNRFNAFQLIQHPFRTTGLRQGQIHSHRCGRSNTADQ